jgi:phosphatidylserine decarboxylase
MTAIKNSLFYVLLFLLPKNLISCLMGHLVSIRLPGAISLRINRWFAQAFKIDLSEAEMHIEEYACLQDFFIRRLKPGLRPIPARNDVVISPCDGKLSKAGVLDDGQLIQSKGKLCTVLDLVEDTNLANRFHNGHYASLYLSPRDYHRFHAPMDGLIQETIFIPGSLWPVNGWAVENIKDLFCQNERIISLFAHPMSNLMLAHIAIGATMVGKIELDYCQFTNKDYAQRKSLKHRESIGIAKGQELGKFMFGSTIVLLFEEGLLKGFAKEAPTCIKMGEVLGNFA